MTPKASLRLFGFVQMEWPLADCSGLEVRSLFTRAYLTLSRVFKTVAVQVSPLDSGFELKERGI